MANNPKMVKVERIMPRLLTYEDAAAYLGIGVKTLRNKISLGTLPFKPRRIASKPLFDLKELEQFCDSLKSDDA